MKYSSLQGGLPSGNPIANIFVIIVGALAIAASVVLGFFAFVIVGSIVLIMAAIIGLRVWWFKRKMRAQPGSNRTADRKQPVGIIEGEFHVVAEDDKDE